MDREDETFSGEGGVNGGPIPPPKVKNADGLAAIPERSTRESQDLKGPVHLPNAYRHHHPPQG